MPRFEHDADSGREIGAGSLLLLRLTSAVFLLVLGWFLVDAIVG